MARKPKSLMRGLVERVGVRKGYRLMAFLVAWDVARREIGRPITIEEYGDWWKVSRATAYREIALMREAFGDEFATPEPLIEAAMAQHIAVSELGWSW